MSKYIATTCEFCLHEDSWDEGEVKFINRWTENLKPADDIKAILESVPYLWANYHKSTGIRDMFDNDPCEEGDLSRFDSDLTVAVDANGDIVKPTEKQYEMWKAGDINLYNLHIALWIEKLSDLDETDLEAWNQFPKE